MHAIARAPAREDLCKEDRTAVKCPVCAAPDSRVLDTAITMLVVPKS